MSEYVTVTEHLLRTVGDRLAEAARDGKAVFSSVMKSTADTVPKRYPEASSGNSRPRYVRDRSPPWSPAR